MCLLSSSLLLNVTYFDILNLHFVLHFFYLNNSLDKIKLQTIFFIYRRKQVTNFQKNRNRFSLLPQMNEQALLYSYLRTVVNMALFHHFSNDPAHALHNSTIAPHGGCFSSSTWFPIVERSARGKRFLLLQLLNP